MHSTFPSPISLPTSSLASRLERRKCSENGAPLLLFDLTHAKDEERRGNSSRNFERSENQRDRAIDNVPLRLKHLAQGTVGVKGKPDFL